MCNSRDRRHAARRASRNANRAAKAVGCASYVTGNSPIDPNKVAAKTAGKMTCYVPGALCRMDHARKTVKRWGIK